MKELGPFIDSEGRLTALPAKQGKKQLAIAYLAEKFEPGRLYSEKEVNEVLLQWHTFRDPATLRRELYNRFFLDRRPDGSAYWRQEPEETK